MGVTVLGFRVLSSEVDIGFKIPNHETPQAVPLSRCCGRYLRRGTIERRPQVQNSFTRPTVAHFGVGGPPPCMNIF